MLSTIEQSATAAYPTNFLRDTPETVEFLSALSGSTTSFLINGDTYTVPAGKRLVVHCITGSVTLDTPESIQCWLVVGKGNDSTRSHALPLQPPASVAPSREYELAVNALVCVEPLASISFWLARSNAAGSWSASFRACGYLMDIGATI